MLPGCARPCLQAAAGADGVAQQQVDWAKATGLTCCGMPGCMYGM